MIELAGRVVGVLFAWLLAILIMALGLAWCNALTVEHLAGSAAFGAMFLSFWQLWEK